MKKFEVWEGGTDCDGVVVEDHVMKVFDSRDDAEEYLQECREWSDGVGYWIMEQGADSAERVA